MSDIQTRTIPYDHAGTALEGWLASPAGDAPRPAVLLVHEWRGLGDHVRARAEQIAGWKKVTDAVHAAGGRIALQIWHVGRISDPSFYGGDLPVGPSAIAASGHVSLLRPEIIRDLELPRHGLKILPLPSTVTFRQYIRTGDNIDPYVGGADVTPQNPPFNLSACPALSTDGLRLFYTSTVGETFDPTDYATFAVYYTTRSTLDAPWDPVTRIPGLVGADGIPCVSSVTADGCQLVYYTATLLGTEPSKFIAQRAIP